MRHPSSETLERLLRGELTGRRLEVVRAHLERGCPTCQEELELLVSFLMIDGRAAPEAPGPEEYEVAVRAAAAGALARSRELKAERAEAAGWADALCARPDGERFSEQPAELRQRAATWSVCEELLRRSIEMRSDDPPGMVRTARLAVAVGHRLGAARYGRAPLADLRARTHAELANALRVVDDLRAADREMALAARLLRRGTGQPAVAARVAELTASLRAHQRRFREVFQPLDQALEIHVRARDRTAVGRTLILKGLYSGYQGDLDGAMQLLRQGLRLVSPRRDAKLRFIASHNLLLFMAQRGEYREARVALFRLLPLYHRHAGKIDWARLRGLEARIAFGLGEWDKAERAFRLKREGFEQAGLAVAAAIADLELVTVWLRMGTAEKLQESHRTIGRLVDFFRGLGVEREALGAVLLLSEAQMRDALSVELVEATLRILLEVDLSAGSGG